MAGYKNAKRCTSCCVTLPVTEFYLMRKTSDKRNSYCRKCDNSRRADRKRAYRIRHPKPRPNGWEGLDSAMRDRIVEMGVNGETLSAISQETALSYHRLHYYRRQGRF